MINRCGSRRRKRETMKELDKPRLKRMLRKRRLPSGMIELAGLVGSCCELNIVEKQSLLA